MVWPERPAIEEALHGAGLREFAGMGDDVSPLRDGTTILHTLISAPS